MTTLGGWSDADAAPTNPKPEPDNPHEPLTMVRGGLPTHPYHFHTAGDPALLLGLGAGSALHLAARAWAPTLLARPNVSWLDTSAPWTAKPASLNGLGVLGLATSSFVVLLAEADRKRGLERGAWRWIRMMQPVAATFAAVTLVSPRLDHALAAAATSSMFASVGVLLRSRRAGLALDHALLLYLLPAAASVALAHASADARSGGVRRAIATGAAAGIVLPLIDVPLGRHTRRDKRNGPSNGAR